MLQNILKIEGGDPFETLKSFEKKTKNRKKKNFEPVSECQKTW